MYPCQNNGTCVDLEDDYECQCIEGFTGDKCETNINECSSNPCINGKCLDGINEYTCQCNPGYYGQNCDTQIPPSPTEDPKYHIIDQKCYFFDKASGTYANSKEKCRNAFNGQGKMFEPKTMAQFKKVHKYGRDNLDKDIFWIGVNDKAKEGTFVYESNGASIPFTPDWYGKNGFDGTRGTSANCILLYENSLTWMDYECNNSAWGPRGGTICEQK